MIVMDIYLQIAWNSLTIAALIAMMAASFTLIYSVTRVVHVAHGGVVLASGYFFYFGWTHGFGFVGAAALAVILAAILGVAINALVYEPLRRRRPLTGTAGMLASVAALIVIQNLLLAVWSSHTIVLHTPLERVASWAVGPLVVTPVSVLILSVAIPVFVFCALLMRFTKVGRAMRAVSDHEEMAEVVGINSKRIRMMSFAFFSAIGGLAGVLAALFYNLQPPYAVGFAVDAFSTAIVGGIGSLGGTVVAAIFINTLTNLGGFWMTAGIKTLFAFVVVFLFLLLRPQGIFGKKRR